MSGKELALQHDMFTGALVDNRSDSQRKKDKERSNPLQVQMFKTPETVSFGNRTPSMYKDWLNQATPAPLVLETQDVRTPEEIERDLLREVQKQMKPLFENEALTSQPETEEHQVSNETPLPLSGVIFDSQTYYRPVGLRAKLRAESIPVRTRYKAA